MSESENQVNQEQDDLDDAETPPISAADEMAMLKSRAKMMGITFSNNISLDKLRERIEAKMDGLPEVKEKPAEVSPLEPTKTAKKITTRQAIRNRELRLIRLRITNMDPKKSNLPGEIFTVANRYLGTVRKYVPYGEVTDEGYHVPYCIYKMLQRKRFLNIRTSQGRNGQQVQVSQAWAKEFALEELPQLTREELTKLASAQSAAGIFAPG